MFDSFMPGKSTIVKLMTLKAILDKRQGSDRHQGKKNDVATEPERKKNDE